jgi:hypothetical protein
VRHRAESHGARSRDDRGDGPAIEGRGHKIVTVMALAANRKKEIAG